MQSCSWRGMRRSGGIYKAATLGRRHGAGHIFCRRKTPKRGIWVGEQEIRSTEAAKCLSVRSVLSGSRRAASLISHVAGCRTAPTLERPPEHRGVGISKGLGEIGKVAMPGSETGFDDGLTVLAQEKAKGRVALRQLLRRVQQLIAATHRPALSARRRHGRNAHLQARFESTQHLATSSS